MIELLILAVVLLYIAGAILMSIFLRTNGFELFCREVVFWPVATLCAFISAAWAIKERKNEK